MSGLHFVEQQFDEEYQTKADAARVKIESILSP